MSLQRYFSGTSYLTANLFFRGVCEIKILLIDWCNSSDPTICEMATAMNVKFDKYCKKSNVALVVANVLDPRFKRRIVEFYLRKIYRNSFRTELDKFNGVLRKIYQCYVAIAPSSKSSKTPSPLNQFMDSVDDELDKVLFEGNSYGSDGQLSELDKYLAEPPLRASKAKQNTFDILAYWKSQKEEYSALSLLARDVLATQVSTVASESAFSAGGRVIDAYRSRLDPNMVEALVCTKDWIT
ncbi:activator-like transposable element [Panicum miliaceum]|uniref:Activator-like transposable element n=1 Tax=Panicum miliaceum TaxID=4540 RepID=A0A3L6TKJ7_PANMI|nr:activator-like transposable element [Panicum miliaceum]